MAGPVSSYVRIPSQHGTESALFLVGAVVVIIALLAFVAQRLDFVKADNFFLMPYLRFAYVSFFKPHTGTAEAGQQSALESFYSAQASIYDATRKSLLRGREDMLGAVAAQLQLENRRPVDGRRPVWFDIGGGTGYNIEVMDKIVGLEDFFEHVYLIDLSPSLCDIARERVKKLGWTNVSVLCQDARTMQAKNQTADLITMSYSLSMIPDFYSVVDLITALLSPRGMIGICDFYVQSIVDVSGRNYTGGTINRHVNWLGRMFWRTWFDADRVNLDAGRRDYVEYRFGTILSASERNYLLGGIPYYIFIGCLKEAESIKEKSRESLERLDATITESPYLSPQEHQQARSAAINNNPPRSKSYESAIVNLSASLPLPAAFYQTHHWRLYYNELLSKHAQFKGEYIYAFNWEDPSVDRDLLNITKDDVMLTITSAGDNIMDYLLESPKRIHAVDLNPNQNHLLELKCAAFTALPHEDCWALFADGTHPNFRELLITKLSPHVSSNAFQFWLNHASTFSPSGRGLYATGGSRHMINLARWLFRIFNVSSRVKTMCSVETLNEQKEIWYNSVRDVLLSWPLYKLLISSEWWLWKAAGVPKEQRDMINNDYVASLAMAENESGLKVAKSSKQIGGEAIFKYFCDSLDPVVRSTLLSTSNYFYYLCLNGKYSKSCHPRYLSARSHKKLSKPKTFDGLRIHTDELLEVIARFSPETLTIAIVLDSMDWFTPPEPKSVHFDEQKRRSASKSRSTEGEKAAVDQINALHRVLKVGGRVLLRSAALRPWYIDLFEQNGFRVVCAGRRDAVKYLDRVNTYASCWICVKRGGTPPNSPKMPGSPKSAMAKSRRRSTGSSTSSIDVEKVRGRIRKGALEDIMLPGAAMDDDDMASQSTDRF